MTLVRGQDGGVRELSCPLWLFRLLTRKPIDTGRMKLGPENLFCIDFANRLRAHSMQGRLRGTWTHVPNEVGYAAASRTARLRYAISMALGLIPGAGDYVFVRADAGLWLEAKRPKLTVREHGRRDSGGVLNEEQAGFKQWCLHAGTPYEIFTSPEEGEAILRQYGFLEGGS